MIDPVFQSNTMHLAEKLLDASALQQQAIAANLANAETPGYRRVDLAPDFEARLKATCEEGGSPAAIDALKPTLAEDASARIVTPDGNSVEIDHELLAMNRNAVEYNYLTDIVTYNIKQLKVAIDGQPS